MDDRSAEQFVKELEGFFAGLRLPDPSHLVQQGCGDHDQGAQVTYHGLRGQLHLAAAAPEVGTGLGLGVSLPRPAAPLSSTSPAMAFNMAFNTHLDQLAELQPKFQEADSTVASTPQASAPPSLLGDNADSEPRTPTTPTRRSRCTGFETPPCPPPPRRRSSSFEDLNAESSASDICFEYTMRMLRSGAHEEPNVIMYAVQNSHLDHLKILLDEGMTEGLDRHHAGGRRGLHEAILRSRSDTDCGYEMAQLLLKHGANANSVPGDHESPLFQAASMCSSAVKLLLQYRADAGEVNAMNQTVLHALVTSPFVPSQAKQSALAEVVVAHGANPIHVDVLGGTARLYCLDPIMSATMEALEMQFRNPQEQQPAAAV
eukprot:TRINITY_DN3310_c0_g1_i5.p1 TRINITY_DN3310_c0_g1~~TRINITY_DN3310_c0_g1_i5.p1  ORF type:complete len:373 (+),score=71.98 TRINITY_DN3310_c0_g1_i5:159-1277(+)